MIEQLAASRCSVCGFVAAPPARWCPRHPVEMVRTSVIGAGEVVSFTTLHSPPQGFRSPEAVDDVYYFSHLGAIDRARLFWSRAGHAGERLSAIARSVAKRAWKGRSRGGS
jgi:hypothetical protein